MESLLKGRTTRLANAEVNNEFPTRMIFCLADSVMCYDSEESLLDKCLGQPSPFLEEAKLFLDQAQQ